MKSRPASRPRLVSSSHASSVAATTSGWVTEVSVISSAVAVVPSRVRSRPLDCDQAASTVSRPGQLEPGGEHAGGLRSLSGSKQCEHVFKRTL